MRHFLDLRDFDSGTLQGILDHAASMKAALKAGAAGERPLEGKSVAIFSRSPRPAPVCPLKSESPSLAANR